MEVKSQRERRRTFAIVSHPDAGKTTVTEKLLLLGNAIQLAGSVKAKKTGRQAKSDWMAIERERGISVTTSVMQFDFEGRVVNLLDTPGHEDFSEDTYRTLTAVDSALMVVDAAKGVEPRTRKLFEICRLRDTPIVTLVNKLDRESMDPISLMDHIEDELQIECTPMTWSIGSGRTFRGIYRFETDEILVFVRGHGDSKFNYPVISGFESDEAKEFLGHDYDEFVEEITLLRGVYAPLNRTSYSDGIQTPVFFGTALHNFGIEDLLKTFVEIAPSPLPRQAGEEMVHPDSPKFTGFVFKIQANMNPNHRDRIAFMRICSGKYTAGMKMKHVRIGKEIKVTDAVTFMAGNRSRVEEAYPGDILGLHNHGTIRIGDTFTGGPALNFNGVPNFAPELFKSVRVKDPLHAKRLKNGIRQLSEEGVTQIFMPLTNHILIVGAVGSLQFDLVAYRLKEEYGADCIYEPCNVHTVRWVSSDDRKIFSQFFSRAQSQLARDGGDHLALLATSRPNLQLLQERWPEVNFASTREHAAIAEA